MANTYQKMYIQAVFAVKYRDAQIKHEWKEEFMCVIGQLINETGCKTIIVNGVEDHVHCFFMLKSSVSITELMKMVKSRSSKWVNDHGKTKSHFEWQRGYGVFSYAKSQFEAVRKYIQNQEEHHKKRSFKVEFIDFLEKFEIEYDEQYLFEELV